ncbi:hypothetical protein NDU88_003350 [Pleurodeles waltl]|uniref:Uncharacterized protein n=1 Tax=Pleurodeles waltl TaxID=8319 RepID=A0AAV7VF76_PLEWA|nr:hypothetical protein NDU88_003350 [Pleurodeles waltl]
MLAASPRPRRHAHKSTRAPMPPSGSASHERLSCRQQSRGGTGEEADPRTTPTAAAARTGREPPGGHVSPSVSADTL